jgi:hypothetical protein
VDLSDEDADLTILALQHYAAYLRATNRDASPFLQIAEKLLKKPPQSEPGTKTAAKKKA